MRQQPLEDQAGDVPGVRRRGVVHRPLGGVGLVVEHRRRALGGLADQVFADDHHRHPRRADVLLRPGVDQAELRNVDRPGEDRRGHVGDQRDLPGGRHVGELDAADRLVRGVVDVRGVGVELELRRGRRPHELVGLGRGGDLRRAELLRLADRFFRPGAGVDVVGALFARQQVHRDHRELLRGAPLQEEDLVVRRDRHQRAQIGLGLLGDGHVILAAVAHLHHGHARTVPVEHLPLRLLQNLQRDRRRPRAEIVDTTHGLSPLPPLALSRRPHHARTGEPMRCPLRPVGDSPEKTGTCQQCRSVSQFSKIFENYSISTPSRGRDAAAM